MYFSI